MEIPLAGLAAMLGGELTEPQEGATVVRDVRSLDAAGPGHVAFLWDAKFAEAAAASGAAAIVCKEPVPGKVCIRVADPQRALGVLLGEVYAQRHPAPPAGVHPRAHVDEAAQLGEGCAVGPLAVVEAGARLGPGTRVLGGAYVGRGVVTGADCVIHPNATVLDHCRLGDRVVVWSGAVVGKDGFGFLQDERNRHTRVPQVGGVVLEDDVEVGALTTVARGALEDTRVGRGVKIDDHCHVAHNCDLGENVMLIGYARLGGSVTIGDNAYLLQDSAVGQGHSVGAGAIIGSGAKARYGSVEAGDKVLGDPARPHILTKRIEATLPKLPDMRRRLTRLEQRVDALGG